VALYPQVRRALEGPVDDLPVHHPDYDLVAARASFRALAAEQPREDVAQVVDLDADGVRCRLYRPTDPVPGVIVHLHGGGVVCHDIDVHDSATRRLANRSGLAVLSVDYRLAPEHPFPAARDDVDTVLGWLERESAALGLEGPAYVHGDSAGGNLALVAALRHPGRFRAVALIYPFLDPTAGFASYADPVDGGFTPQEAAWYWQQYAASPADLTDPDLAPLLSDRLGTLPPTMVVTAEHDPLRDEGEELARRAAEAGAVVVASRQLGQVHGFWRHAEVFDAAEPVLRQVAGFFRCHHS
jgi:acetyl esterase